MFVNDEWERYVRMLQTSGDASLHPWSIRGFGPLEVERVTPRTAHHPWAAFQHGSTYRIAGVQVHVLPALASFTINSRFPFGYNDGPVWAGRGLTTAVSGGAAARFGPLSVVLAPTAFRAENASISLMPTGQSGAYRFADGFQDGNIDQPQRFGDRPYMRLDPGNSTIRLDVGSVAAGFSTANQHWGPARDHPVLLGNNAAGFPHVFVGTSRPVHAWLADAHARLLWGKLGSSPYTNMRDVEPDRFATGLAVSIVPRGIPGLELGAARFFHVLWSDSVINATNLTHTFRGLLRRSAAAADNPANAALDNQLASLFGRWVFPESGFELYGEYGREASYGNVRDLLMNPNNDVAYLLGFQRVWKRSSGNRTALSAEMLNTRISGLQIAHEQTRFYVHSPIGQGHTQLGQVLGSAGGYGGGASTIALTSYSASGRWNASWSRINRAEHRRLPSLPIPNPQAADVFHTFGIDGIRFRGRMALSYELTAVYELNRDFASDSFNIRATSGLRYAW